MRPRGASPFVRDLFDPVNTPLFIFGALALAILSDALYDLLYDLFGADRRANGLLVVLTVVVVVAVVLALQWRYERRARRRSLIAVRSEERATPRRALIAVTGVSQASNEPLEAAIQHHGQTLRHCWLLTTRSARSEADRIRQRYDRPGLTIAIEDIAEAEDAGSTLKLVGRLLDGLAAVGGSPPLDQQDVIVDITGGLKPITTGAVLASAARGVALEYVRAERDPQGRPVPGGKLEVIRVDYDIELRQTQGGET